MNYFFCLINNNEGHVNASLILTNLEIGAFDPRFFSRRHFGKQMNIQSIENRSWKDIQGQTLTGNGPQLPARHVNVLFIAENICRLSFKERMKIPIVIFG